MTKLEWALNHARNGWEVFPLVPNTKIPFEGSNGFKDATLDEQKIRESWAKEPNSNIGIRAGHKSNLAFLDVDNKKDRNGRKSLSTLKGIPLTLSVSTPNDGFHMYFLHDQTLESWKDKLPGLELLAKERYVVAPGSEIDGKKYEWIDPEAPIVNVPDSIKNLGLKKGNDKDYKDLRTHEKINDGDRNNTLKSLAGLTRSAGFKTPEINVVLQTINKDRFNPPLPEKTVREMAERYSSYPEKKRRSLQELINRENLSKPLHIAQDYVDGIFYFGVVIGKERILIGSDRVHRDWDQIKEDFLILDSNFSQSRFTSKGLSRFLEDKSVSPPLLFNEIEDYFRESAFYKFKEIPSFLALWVMGTYIYSVFEYFPYIWFNSPSKRSGKTLLLERIGSLAFNSSPITTNLSESWLFREPSANRTTLLLDELENLKDSDKEKWGNTMAVLNAGFKKGATVPRIEKIKNQFRTVNFHVYSPKCLAGINRLADTIQDRSLKIEMIRKKKSEKLKRFDRRIMEPKLSRIRDDLYLFGLNYAGTIFQNYQNPDQFPIPEQLDDRARDIVEPLYAISTLIDQKDEPKQNTATDKLRSFCLVQAGLRAESEMDEENIPQLITMLRELEFGKEGKTIITPDNLLEQFKDSGSFDWIDNKTKAGRMVRRLGFRSKTHRVGGEVKRGYLIEKPKIEDLAERYLSSDTPPPSPSIESVTSVTNQQLEEELIDNEEFFPNDPYENESVTED